MNNEIKLRRTFFGGYVSLLLLLLTILGFLLSGGLILLNAPFLGKNKTNLEGENDQYLVRLNEDPSPIPSYSSLQLASSFCGLNSFDIVLVIDYSGSIDSQELDQMKSAMISFMEVLGGTSSQIAVVGFSTVANISLPFTEDIESVKSVIKSFSSNGSTNWEDALVKAQSLLPNSPNPDLIIFASDGDPNTIGPTGQPLLSYGGQYTEPALSPAVAVADVIKSTGARIVALGIGNQVNVESMKAISGPIVGNDLNADVIISDFKTLAIDLASIANTCVKDE